MPLPIAIALVTIFGTLAGTALGIIGSWLVQKRQLDYADATRFHERRLTAYLQFLTANNVFRDSDFTGKRRVDMEPFDQALELVRLIGSDSVLEAAEDVQLTLYEAGSGASSDRGGLIDKYSGAFLTLRGLMRKEIGISKQEPFRYGDLSLHQ
jgi:hypothetical protein